MPKGFSGRRLREFKLLRSRFHDQHRYPGREDEVAARIVNQQRAQAGETKEAKARKAAGRQTTKSK